MEKEFEISIWEIVYALWHRVYIIVLCTILGGGIAFGVTNYMMKPEYSSAISMYVNNNTDRVGTQLNINDINASQKLVATYIEILKSDLVLNKVIDKMGLEYSNSELNSMIKAKSLNDTEILEIVVTSEDPDESANIANMLAEIGPPEIIRVVRAGGVQLIDTAVPSKRPVGPNVRMATISGSLVGAALACALIIILVIMDTRIKSEADLQKSYGIPVLGVVPDILETIKKQS